MLYGIILAAGEGKRMKSATPKVLHNILGKPMLYRVVSAVKESGVEKIFVVTSPSEKLINYIESELPFATSVIQDTPLGTGDAVRRVLEYLEDGYSLIIPGDVPLLSGEVLKEIVNQNNTFDALIVTTYIGNPYGYGRIIRDANGNIKAIIEEKDADEDTKKIKEINTGVYVIANSLLKKFIPKLTNENAQQEYYLTDVITMAVKEGYKVKPYLVENSENFMGVNSRKQLVEVEKIYLKKIIEKHLNNGVTIHFPESVYIEPEVEIGRDCEIFSNVYLTGKTTIGENCTIQSGVRIENSRIGNGVIIKDNSYIEEAIIGDNCKIGPMAHLRPGSVLADKVSIGNFVETKKAEIGRGTKINHLSYIGDAELGEDVNIGAGTITCNYDGFFKYKTKIGNRVFVGSDTQLVAPVELEDDVYIGAGSTITKNVPKGYLSLTRAEQKFIKDYTYRKRAKMEKIKQEKKKEKKD